METRRVYVIDDEIQVLEVMKIQLESMGFGAQTYSSSETFLLQMPRLPPGVVIADQRMPFANGLEIQRRLKEFPSSFKMILLSGFPETRVAVEAMRQGAITVLDKPYQREELLDSLNQAFKELRRSMADEIGLPDALPGGGLYLDSLSRREREVIDLVYRGATNKSVSIALGISIKTVEKHRSKAMRKMQVSSLAELVRLLDRELPLSET